MKVELKDFLSISVSGGEYPNNEFLSNGEQDATCQFALTGETPVVEVIYKADVQPCIVIGLRSDEFAEANICAEVARTSRLVVAIGMDGDEEQYCDPVVDMMLSEGSPYVIPVSLSSKAS